MTRAEKAKLAVATMSDAFVLRSVIGQLETIETSNIDLDSMVTTLGAEVESLEESAGKLLEELGIDPTENPLST